MKMVRYAKYQAVGNAYIILKMAALPSSEQISTLCHPAYGLGGDGVLIGRVNHSGVFSLRIFKDMSAISPSRSTRPAVKLSPLSQPIRIWSPSIWG